ncbi:hypothetical protein SBA2_70006 [Acidobacteriia bacterium SbA2]|nr:hypothetical protein SBA2_70006 [Acidobacteriia bacterium SbA2]
MNLPWSDSLETVENFHSFLESWAVLFFVGVVLCDVILRPSYRNRLGARPERCAMDLDNRKLMPK